MTVGRPDYQKIITIQAGSVAANKVAGPGSIPSQRLGTFNAALHTYGTLQTSRTVGSAHLQNIAGSISLPLKTFGTVPSTRTAPGTLAGARNVGSLVRGTVTPGYNGVFTGTYTGRTSAGSVTRGTINLARLPRIPSRGIGSMNPPVAMSPWPFTDGQTYAFNLGLSNRLAFAARYYLPFQAAISNIANDVTSGTVRFGIYKVGTASGLPWVRRGYTGSVVGGGAASRDSPLHSPVVLDPGVYFIVASGSNNTNVPTLKNAYKTPWPLSGTLSTKFNPFLNTTIGLGTAGDLPGTLNDRSWSVSNKGTMPAYMPHS